MLQHKLTVVIDGNPSHMHDNLHVSFLSSFKPTRRFSSEANFTTNWIVSPARTVLLSISLYAVFSC